MKPIPKPTKADESRDMEADYDYVRKYERMGDGLAIACAYIRLTQALRKRLAALEYQPEMPAAARRLGKTKDDGASRSSTG